VSERGLERSVPGVLPEPDAHGPHGRSAARPLWIIGHSVAAFLSRLQLGDSFKKQGHMRASQISDELCCNSKEMRFLKMNFVSPEMLEGPGFLPAMSFIPSTYRVATSCRSSSPDFPTGRRRRVHLFKLQTLSLLTP